MIPNSYDPCKKYLVFLWSRKGYDVLPQGSQSVA
jgi:hypothetical protein